jgi:hypothetical protein
MTKIRDLTGNRVGRLIVLEVSPIRRNNRVTWECLCDCGKKTLVVSSNLIRKKILSCGCLSKELQRKRYKNLIGERFSRLLVMEKTDKRCDGGVVWLCKCDCGKETFVMSSNLIRGNTRSCGCLFNDTIHEVKSLPYGISSFNSLYSSYIGSAKKRNLSFELTRDEFINLVQQNCFYCGNPPTQFRRDRQKINGLYLYNGIDRLDNNVGYELDNCVPCCVTCNYAKRTRNYNEFIDWLHKVCNHLSSKETELDFSI